MKFTVAFLVVLLSATQGSCQVLIHPSVPPVVNAGGTLTFTANTQVRWAMATGSKGTIDAITGVYSAPSSIKAQQSFGGCQLLPNNHIFNTRIDSLPVNAQSSLWIAAADHGTINYLPSFPMNYVDVSTPKKTMQFLYTPGNDGTFYTPTYPGVKIENGYFVVKGDKHQLAIDPSSCAFQEMYHTYAAGTNSKCARCTAQSGVQYKGSTYDLPVNGATDAGGMYLMPLSLHFQELQRAVAVGGSISHALRFTLSPARLSRTYIWPAMAEAPSSGIIPYGARFRLKASFDIARFSPTAQVLLKQLQQYGIILADMGAQWQVTIDQAKVPDNVVSAFNEISAAVRPTDMEAVDESALMVSSTSGATTSNTETVIATSVANPSQMAQMQVVLAGVAISLPNDQLYLQAGTKAQQFTAFVSGSSNKEVVWSMSPVVGTLTSTGAYTPPTHASSALETTITATSAADDSIAATMPLTVLPDGTIRIAMGSTTPYTDSLGNVWQASTGADVGGIYINGWFGPMPVDSPLYRVQYFAGGDLRFDISVPNGEYEITAKFASTNSKGPGQCVFGLEAQGKIVLPNVDVWASAGGEYLPVDFTLPATVTSGQLSFVIRRITGESVYISALQIVALTDAVNVERPAPPTKIKVIP
jgi:hypothetical protein